MIQIIQNNDIVGLVVEVIVQYSISTKYVINMIMNILSEMTRNARDTTKQRNDIIVLLI